MAPTPVTLNSLEGHSPIAGLFKCNSSTICAAFYKISNDTVHCMVLGDSCASCVCNHAFLFCFIMNIVFICATAVLLCDGCIVTLTGLLL